MHAWSLMFGKKMSADGKPACGRTRIWSDFARKINRKEVLGNYNKTKINIGHHHDRWMELKEALSTEVSTSVQLHM